MHSAEASWASAAKRRQSARPLVLLLAAAIFINYIDRGSIAIAAPLMKEDLALSTAAFGIAISAFFWVYTPVQLLIGPLCDRFSVYRLLAAGVTLWAVTTMLIGFAAGFASLVVLRLLLGLGESVAVPGCCKVVCHHVPAERRGIANAAIAAATSVGPVFSTLVGGALILSFGWRPMFVLFGITTLMWLIPWHRTVRSLHDGTRISAVSGRASAVPMSILLRRRALWAMSIGHFTMNYGGYFVGTWLPLYLVKQRGFSLEETTLLTTLYFCAGSLSNPAVGWASDAWVARGHSEAVVRKAILVGHHIAVAICILGLATAGSGRLIPWLVVTGFAMGSTGGNHFSVAQMFAGPRAAGAWMGVQNSVGNVAGIVAPVITGLIVDRSGNYFYAFVVGSAISLIGAFCWGVLMPRVDPIDWPDARATSAMT